LPGSRLARAGRACASGEAVAAAVSNAELQTIDHAGGADGMSGVALDLDLD